MRVGRRAPGQLGPGALGAGAGRGERRGVFEQLPHGRAQRVDVVRRHDPAGAVAADDLAEAADVVDDRRDAGPERLQQRAALVELGAVGEDRDGRLAERATRAPAAER